MADSNLIESLRYAATEAARLGVLLKLTAEGVTLEKVRVKDGRVRKWAASILWDALFANPGCLVNEVFKLAAQGESDEP